jgi:hypothetical protein
MARLTSEDIYAADICGKCDLIIREGQEVGCEEVGCNPELHWSEIFVADIDGEPHELTRTEITRIDNGEDYMP